MYLVDTNIFLEVLLSGARKERCKALLMELRDGVKRAIVTDLTIHSIVVIMDRLERLRELRTFLESLPSYKGLHIHHTTLRDEIRAVEIAGEKGLDMDDAIQFSSALTVKAEAIISYDKHFDGLEMPRIEP